VTVLSASWLADEIRREATRLALCACLAVGVAGCGGTEVGSSDASAELGAACPDLPAGVSASPRTIGQTVDFVNALVGASASPLTLPASCSGSSGLLRSSA
jgi:hypothetical protein